MRKDQTTRPQESLISRWRNRLAAVMLNRQGASLYNKGEYRQAIEEFTRAIEVSPEFAESYDRRGKTYAALGEHRRAIDDYDKAVA